MSDQPTPASPAAGADLPIHPAATVMLVRDANASTSATAPAVSAGIEVFMLRRTANAVFGAGMYVFPGGRVDESDGASGAEEFTRGLDDEEASKQLGVPSGGLAFWIAAVRESFEEAGVLLGARRDGGRVELDPRDRHLVHDGTVPIVDLCRERGLVIDLSLLHYVDHWVTPLGEPRRFDTRFFLAEVPPHQVLVHDDLETVDSLWVRPGDAVTMFAERQLQMMPPTIANLRRLAEHSSVADALAAAEAIVDPPRIEPRLRLDGAGRTIGLAMPWDDDYERLGPPSD